MFDTNLVTKMHEHTVDLLGFSFCLLMLEAETAVWRGARKPNIVAIFTRIDSGNPESSGRPIVVM